MCVCKLIAGWRSLLSEDLRLFLVPLLIMRPETTETWSFLCEFWWLLDSGNQADSPSQLVSHTTCTMPDLRVIFSTFWQDSHRRCIHAHICASMLICAQLFAIFSKRMRFFDNTCTLVDPCGVFAVALSSNDSVSLGLHFLSIIWLVAAAVPLFEQ